MFTYPLLAGSGNLTVLFKFTPYRPLLPQQPFKSCKILHYSQWKFQSNQRFLFKDKIGCRLTRTSNAETQLLGYTAWQWDGHLVPQNVFLVDELINRQALMPYSRHRLTTSVANVTTLTYASTNDQ